MWYVVQTISGREQASIEKCRNALPGEIAMRIFSPVCQFEKLFKREWKIEAGIAFPGYVFIESESPERLEKELRNISSVVTPVCIGGGFYPIRKEEEEMLLHMMDENNCIRTSVGYQVDQKLIVRSGPLSGLEEHVKWIDRHKRVADVEILLFEERRKMRVGLEVKGKMTTDEYRQLIQSA